MAALRADYPPRPGGRPPHARPDTGNTGDIHQAKYQSYHTRTPNGYNLQISYVTHENRQALANAVKPIRK